MTTVIRLRWVAAVVSSVAIVSASACTALKYSKMAKPKVSIKDIDVKSIDIKGADLLFNVIVENPNEFSIKVDSLRYDIEIGGENVGGQQIKNPTEIAGHTSQTVGLPLRLSFSELFASLGGFLKQEMTDYRVKGEAKIGVLTLPFVGQGQFRLTTDGKIVHEKK